MRMVLGSSFGRKPVLDSSFRRKPESILTLLFDASREPTRVLALFRPPSWRPGHFLLLEQEKVTKEHTLDAAPSPEGEGSLRVDGFGSQAIPGLRAECARSLACPRVRCTRLFRPPSAAALEGTRRAKSNGRWIPAFAGMPA
jgi:hypothetical protein